MRDEALPPWHWNVFCRVVDNHGDLGVCWRLSRRLVALGQRVTLWVDDAAALAWMAPGGAPGITLRPWPVGVHDDPDAALGDVVVEAFGCDPPPGFVARMAAAARPPAWINLEYLSAEDYALRSHGLPSPQFAGPGCGLTKWFFYPGFAPESGGLLLEPGLVEARDAFDAEDWLAMLGIEADAGVRRVSLFCYAQPALAAALAGWRSTPTQLLVTPGPAAAQVAAWLGCDPAPGQRHRRDALDVHFLPWLPQPEFDRLLWACDLNHVRGEDSLVRALWAGRPLLWQLYPQHDGAHAAKLEAFLAVYLQGAEDGLAAALAAAFRRWNGLPTAPAPPPDAAAWQAHAATRAKALQAQTETHGDLGSRLYRFVAARR